MIKKIKEFCEFQNWEYFQFENESKLLERVKNEENWDYEGYTKGIQVQPHENCEPLIFEFDENLYIQEYCKTQFSNIETHIKIVELLMALKQFFNNINIFDEGEYYETNNLNKLQEHWDSFYKTMEKLVEENNKLQGPFKLHNGRIIDLREVL